MFKKSVSFLLAVILLLSMVPVQVFAADESGVNVGSASSHPGNTVSININAQNLSNIASLSLLVTYDSEVMSLSGTSYGALISGNINDANTAVSGEIHFSTMSVNGMNGSGTLMTLNFQISEDCPEGTYPVTVAVGDVYDTGFTPVTMSGTNGAITVTKQEAVQESFNLYSYQNGSSYQKGDTLSVRIASAGKLPFTGAEFSIEYDDTLLEVESVELESALTTEGAVYDTNTSVSGSVKLSYASVNPVQTFYLFYVHFKVIGDVDGTTSVKTTVTEAYKEDLTSYTSAYSTLKATLKKIPVVVDYPDVVLTSQSMIVGRECSAVMTLPAGTNVAAADFVVNYDPEVLQINSVTQAQDVPDVGGMLIVNDNYKEGSIRFSYVNTSAYSEEDLPLVQISWTPLKSPAEHYQVTISGSGVVDLDQNEIVLDYITNSGCIHNPVVTEPSCVAQGYTTYTCGCGDSYTGDTSNIVPHTYEKDILVCDVCEHKRVVTAIAVHTLPAKVEYLERAENLDLTGAVLSVVCDDNATVQIPITADMVTGFDNKTVGEKNLIVTYEGKTTVFTVIVKEIQIDSIQVTPPAKLSYLEGAALDVTGGEVKILYKADNGYYETVALENAMISGYDADSPGKQTLTVSYEGFTDQFQVEVIAKTATKMQITQLPEKLSYFGKRDALDVTGGKIQISYDNQTTQAFDMTGEMVSGFDNTVAGDQELTITWQGVSDTFSVNIYQATVTFENWDGTVLSTKKYMYGDEVEIPETPTREADNTYTYEFKSWDKEVVACAGDATYKATYTPNYIDYTVMFIDWDDEVISSKTYHYGDEVEIPETPTREADNSYTYVFKSWDKEVVACAGDATYKATYTPNYIDYTVTFVNWDDEVISSKTYHYGDEVEIPEEPIRDADNTYTYKFKNWDKEVVACAGNTTYKATYTSNHIDYTVTFVNWDDEVISSKTYHYGDEVTAPANPIKAADNTYTYEFDGWDKDVVACAGDTTYKATYEPIYIDYTVTFVDWDDEVISTKTYHYGDEVEIPEEPTREADNTYTYEFKSWDKEVVACAGDATYKATYEPIYIDYTVTFVDWDDEVISSKTYHYGDEVEIPETPTREADNTYTYEFTSWDKEVVDCAGNATYKATYEPIYIDYTVTFVDWDDEVISTKTYHYGDEVEIPETLTREADNTYTYEFKSWDKEVVACAGDVTYKATYTSHYIDYTVTFVDWDDEVISSETYHYGDKVTVPSNPTKAADNTYTYEFDGWDKDVVACAGNTTYKATYESIYINYTVTFVNWNDEVISSEIYHYGDEVTAPANPTKAADNTYTYEFADWDKEVVACVGNTTYKATYEPIYIDYTVTFVDWDDELLSTKTYHYGDEVEIPEEPIRDADNTYTYEFKSWDKEVVACAGNTTYKATYTPIYIDYTVTFVDWDNEVISSKTYHYGDEVTAPANPTKAADDTYTYNFKGWDKEVVACAGNTTYKATYEPIYIDYTVTFVDWNDEVISSETYHYGDEVKAPADPTREADNSYTYVFKSWDKEVVACAGDASYKATYTPYYIDYTVTFVDWNGEILSTNTYHYGDVLEIPVTPEKAADNTYTYTFSGWDKEVTPCVGDITYTATYKAVLVNYTVVFKNWDGKVLSSKTYHHGDKVTAPANPTKEADKTYTYAFAGWDKEVVNCAGDAVYIATYIISGSHTHNYSSSHVTDPTCTVPGYTTYSCACGSYYNGNSVAATGHSFGSYVSDNNGSPDSEGTKTRTCSKCGDHETVNDAGVRLPNVEISSTQGHLTGNILRWDAVEGADLYQIFRLNNGTWELLANTRGLAYKDETAPEGAKSYYKVRARNGNLMSSMAVASTAVTRPAPVTSLANVTITSITAHTTGNIIYWNAVPNALLYQVYRLNGSSWELLKNTGATAYKDETAPVGVKAYYKIVARRNSLKSNIGTTASASATRPSPITSLNTVTITGITAHKTGNIIYWDAVPNALLYQVYRLNGSSWELLKNTGGTAYKDETAPVGVRSYYKIVARRDSLASNIGATVSASAVRPRN